MFEVTPFHFEEITIRAIQDEDGQAWFVASDVCAALGIQRTSDAVEKLDADEKGTGSIRTLGGQQEVLTVNESGMNAIILRCRDAMTQGTKAHKIRKWVTSEVLPSIHRTGSYSVPQQAFNIPKTLPDALRLAADLADKVEQQRLEIRTLEPKAHAADRLAELQESICLTEAAKHLKVQRKQLVWLMTNYRWMYKRSPKSPWLAYDDKRYAGLLEHAYHSYNDSNGESHDAASLRITPKGLVKLAEMCANQGNFMGVYTHEVATRYDGKRKQLALPH